MIPLIPLIPLSPEQPNDETFEGLLIVRPEGEKRARDRGVEVWLVDMNPGVLETARHAGLYDKLGRERMLFNARMAIQRYQAMQQAAGAAAPANADERPAVPG